MTISAITRMAAAAIAAAAKIAAVPAAASAAPTLTVDHPCYSPGDTIRVGGTGYTASGEVSLTVTAARPYTVQAAADLTGNLNTELRVTDDFVEDSLREDELMHETVLAALDRTKQGQGPLQEAVGVTSFFLSRWGALLSQDLDEMQPTRRLGLYAVGFTGAENRSLYLHYVRDGRRVATVTVGRLRGPCGIVDKTLAHAFPMKRVQAGKWRLVFNLSRTNIRASYGFGYDVTVKRRDATAR